MSVPVCTVDASGISKPDYQEILTYLRDEYRAIYGEDVYLEDDSQDGQFLALIASGINDANAAAVAVFNSFSPSKAQGVALSSNVKINGIARQVATYSTVDLRIVGQVGTVIEDGVAIDTLGRRWLLNSTVTIPASGEVIETATCEFIGAISAAADTVNLIGTPTRGWQSVSNPDAAAPGNPVESDAALRRRQARSVALPARSLLDGIVGAVSDIEGVTQAFAYENTKPYTDENGVPSHSVSMVVEGGDANLIAEAIARNKAPGVRTYGTTEVTVEDAYGIPRRIEFFRPTILQIKATISLRPLTGFTSSTQAAIRAAVAAYITALDPGEDVILSRLYVPANLYGAEASSEFNINSIMINRLGLPVFAEDVPVAFFERARGEPTNIAIQVLR